MDLQDKSIKCFDCGNMFIFSAEERGIFRAKGHANEPKRCPECRRIRKARINGTSNNSFVAQRQMFSATCSECGKNTEVPFQPRGDKPVYCSDCYRKVRPSR